MNDNDILAYLDQNGNWVQIKYGQVIANGWKISGESLQYKDQYGQWSATKVKIVSTEEEEPASPQDTGACSSEEASYARAMKDFQEASSAYQEAVQQGAMVNGKTDSQWQNEAARLRQKISETEQQIDYLQGVSVADRRRQYYERAINGIEGKFQSLPDEKSILGWTTWSSSIWSFLVKARDASCSDVRGGGTGEMSPSPGGKEAKETRTKNLSNMSSYPRQYNSGWGAESLRDNISRYSFATSVIPDMDVAYIRLNALLDGQGCLERSGGGFHAFRAFDKDKSGYRYELKIAEQNYAKAKDLKRASESKIATAKTSMDAAYKSAISAYGSLRNCYMRNDKMSDFAGVVKPEYPTA